MVEIKEEPDSRLIGHEIVYRTAESEVEHDENYYQFGSIRDQVLSIWDENQVDVKPKIEHIEIDPHRQLVISLDEGFLRKNYRDKWIEVVKSTFRRPSMNKACQLCENLLEFNSAAELIKHYAEIHQREIMTYNCMACDYSNRQSQEIRSHWTEKHKTRHRKAVKYTILKKPNDRLSIWIGDDEFVYTFFGKDDRLDHQSEKFECDICSRKITTSKIGLMRHMKWHMKNKSFDNYIQKKKARASEIVECDICLKKLRRHYLWKHKIQQHGVVKNPFECDICGVKFRTKSLIATHMAKHSGVKPFKCKHCPKTFSSPDSLNRHEFTHLKGTLSEDDPREIQYRYNQEKIECEICSRTLKRICLNRHMKTHDFIKRPKFECNKCNKILLQKHKFQHHEAVCGIEKEKREKFGCKVCPKIFLNRETLKHHESKIHSSTPFDDTVECDICSVKVRRSGLTAHKRSRHHENRLICDICDKTFARKGRLISHMAIHSGIKPYKCDKCDKAYATREHLERHTVQIHLKDTLSEDDPRQKVIRYGKELIECETCWKKVPRIWFKAHQLVHTDYKPYQCDLCEMSFKNRGGLKTHKLIHSDETPFECTYCSRKFKQKSYLTRHERIHRDDRPHVCQFCNNKFLHLRYLTAHIRCTHFHLLRQQDRMTGRLNELFQGAKSFECYRCKYSSTRSSVKRHMNTCAVGSKFMNCPDCIQKFDSKPLMNRHSLNFHLPTAIKGISKKAESVKSKSKQFKIKRTISKKEK